MNPSVLGLDIGGANLKAYHTSGVALSRRFALWRQPRRLAEELGELIRQMPAAELLAVTMTAELCDCYADKHEGVNAVLDAVESGGERRRILVWQSDARFASVVEARRDSLKTASANWLALAAFAGRFCPKGPAILCDIGSTTTDIVPLVDGVPVPAGRTDLERLVAGELVYTGVIRTPLCAIVPSFRWHGQTIRPAAELFATTQDAYLLLGELEEEPANTDTADGRSATRAFAHARVARTLCADTSLVSMDEAVKLAEQVRSRQTGILLAAFAGVIGRMREPPVTLICAGAGEFLLREVSTQLPGCSRVVSLAGELGQTISKAACAYAVALLAAERT